MTPQPQQELQNSSFSATGSPKKRRRRPVKEAQVKMAQNPTIWVLRIEERNVAELYQRHRQGACGFVVRSRSRSRSRSKLIVDSKLIRLATVRRAILLEDVEELRRRKHY